MDGVLVDSERHWEMLEGEFFRSLVGRWSSADQARITGVSVHDVYRLLTEEFGLQQPKEEFLALYQRIADLIYMERVSLIEGAPELLASLRREGVRLALASSSPMSWIEMVLDRFGLRDTFEVVVSADELEGGEGKPSPAIYLRTAEKLGLDPRRCVAIEDSRHGVVSAKRAGMLCVGLRNGFNDGQDLSAADLVVRSLTQLDARSLRNLYRQNLYRQTTTQELAGR